MRDATRGGVATVLNEIALAAEVGDACSTRPSLPVRPVVTGACELLGLDPLYVANEGRLVAFVARRLGRRTPWRRCGRYDARRGGSDRR